MTSQPRSLRHRSPRHRSPRHRSHHHHGAARRCSGDDGQLLLLVLVYAVIAGVLVTVVVNLSTAYLHRRSLVAAVDGAALSAANQSDLARVYRGGSDALPLSDEGTADSVTQYVDDARLE